MKGEFNPFVPGLQFSGRRRFYAVGYRGSLPQTVHFLPVINKRKTAVEIVPGFVGQHKGQ